jgi:hypothetical protein
MNDEAATTTPRQQQAEAVKLGAATAAKLMELRYGG